MYVVSGRLKNRPISAPPGIRPTSSRVRKSVFSYLREYIDGKRVLDLFCGSGAFGIESLSNNAGSCDFVDIKRNCIVQVRKNISFLGLTSFSAIHFKDAFRFMRESAQKNSIFDVIFSDPPYHGNLASKFLKTLEEYDILSSAGIVVLQAFAKDKIAYNDNKIRVFDKKKIGQDVVLFFERV